MMIVITRLIESIIALENKINHGKGTSQMRENLSSQNGQTWNHFGRLIKVKYPKFDGEDVQGWLYRVNKLFEMDQVDHDGQKIRLVLTHVFDRALNWHKQIMKRFGEIVT
nr:reverse transcriptase [Tanacetum cinerariifolium]